MTLTMPMRPGWSGSPMTPALSRIYSFDRETRTGHSCSSTSPSCRRYELAPMEPFCFTARDGLTMHGYADVPARGRPDRACRWC